MFAQEVVSQESPFGACQCEVQVGLYSHQVNGLVVSLKVEELLTAIANR